MSKKTSLSSVGSLAACLRFAAQVLLPETHDVPLAPEELTKDVLAPIVVDAHRFGLQMTKAASETRAERNPRKLLQLCRDRCDEKTQKTMDGVAVADVTWDFEGSVADTLEMEIVELLQRARAGGHAICALFSVSSLEISSGGDDYALVWVPAEEAMSAQPRHSMLLYVCPGRVKVVKNVGDLVRKMSEEIKTIRRRDASYSVWTVVAAPKASFCRQDPSRESNSTIPAPSKENKSSSRLDCANSPHPLASKSSVRSGSANNGDDDDNRREIFTRDVQKTMDAPKPPTELSSTSNMSIFHFGTGVSGSEGVCGVEAIHRTQLTPEWGDEVPTRGDEFPIQPNNDEECRLEATIESPPSFEYAPSENQDEGNAKDTIPESVLADSDSSSSCPPRPQSVSTVWTRSRPRIPVCRSSIIEQHPPRQDNTSRLTRSVDSRAASSGPRVSQHGQKRAQVLDAEPLRIPPTLPSPSKGTNPTKSRVIEGANGRENSREREQTRVGVIIRATTKTPPKPSIFAFTTDSSVDREEEISRSVQLEDHADDQQRQQPRGWHNDLTAGDSRTSIPSPPADELPIQTPSPVSHLDCDMRSRSSFAGANKSPCLPQPEQPVAVCPSQEETKKSARDRVRSKFGAKVWWELEYTARRLEQEESQPPQHRQAFSSRWTTDAAQHFSDRGNAKEQVCKSLSVSTMNRELRHDRTKQPAPKTEMPSVLETVNKERSLVNPASTALYESRSEPTDSQPQRGVREELFADTAEKYSSVHADNEQSMCLAATHCVLSTESSRVASSPKWKRSSPMGGSPQIKASVPPPSRDPIASNDSLSISTRRSYSPAPQSVPVEPPIANALVSEQVDSQQFERSRLLSQGECAWCAGSGRVEPPRLSDKQSDQEQEECNAMQHSKDLVEFINTNYDKALLPAKCADPRVLHAVHGQTSDSIDDKTVNQPPAVASPSDSPSGDATLPFHLNGRVPIRTQPRLNSSKALHNDVETVKSPERDRSAPPSLVEDAQPAVVSASQADSSPPTQLRRPSPSAAAATFISFDDVKGGVSAGKKEAAMRMDRLNELRQRKLEQLQKARERALQQQQDKKKHKHAEKKAADAGETPSLAGTGHHHSGHHQPCVKRASNRQQLQNAIEFTLLAGQSTERERLAALEALAQSPAESFVVLLKSSKELKFRALYESRTDGRDEARRIFSVVSSAYAPSRLEPGVVAQFFKYSSAKKQFLPVDTRSFTVATDACALAEQLAFKKPARPRLL